MDQGQTEGTTQEEIEKTLFDEEDMRRVVRDWIEAFIRGDVILPLERIKNLRYVNSKRGNPGKPESHTAQVLREYDT